MSFLFSRNRHQGVALVIVLAFVVLLTGVIVAFFSQALSERQVSNGSANQTHAELFALGAVDVILGDLKQEIAAGSTATALNPASAGVMYVPKAAATAIPAIVGFVPAISGGVESDGMANLVKRSAYNYATQQAWPFYAGTNYDTSTYPPAARAAAVSTLTPSRNGRFISPARWNQGLLLQKANLSSSTDLTPLGATAATATAAAVWSNAPDWVLVARDGSNPATWSAGMITSPANSSSVVGRYAYNIYNEGGLLDANVAGYPTRNSPASGADAPYPAGSYPPIYLNPPVGSVYSPPVYTSARLQSKSSTGSADLTVLPGFSSSPATMVACINQLVGWRNYASASTSANGLGIVLGGAFPFYNWTNSNATNYYSSVLLNPASFVTVANHALAGGQTDRLFSSRQQLINLLTQGIASSGGNNSATLCANLQTALQYLGTFSRSLDRPNYVPVQSTDPSKPGYNASAPQVTGAQYTVNTPTIVSGGNSANGLDALVNPAFATIRVQNAFTATDGSVSAAVGDPLVKRRFALNRLAWLTAEGPSASVLSNNPNDPFVTQAEANGSTQDFLNQGTATNISYYFGLTWTNGPAGPNTVGGYWTYNHGIANTIGTLDTVAALPTGSAREADFFELLKAAVSVGILAKDCPGISQNLPGCVVAEYLLTKGTRVDNHIIQLGANIIAQAAPDSFPPTILFLDNPNSPSTFWGVEDLPYLYGLANLEVLNQAPVPMPSSTADQTPAADNLQPGYNAGSAVALEIPIIWNPHSAATATVPSSLMPTALRVCASNISIASSNSNPGNFGITQKQYAPPLPGNQPNSGPANPPSGLNPVWPASPDNTRAIINMPVSGASGNAAMTFLNNPSLYREPTPLMQANVPSGSNLALDSGNLLLAAGPTAWSSGVPEVNSGYKFIGMYLGTYPIRWTTTQTLPDKTTVDTLHTTVFCLRAGTNLGNTYSLEYQSNGRWFPYAQSTGNFQMDGGSVPHNVVTGSTDPTTQSVVDYWARTVNQGSPHYSTNFFDPRSGRFGVWGDTTPGAFLDAPTCSITKSLRPDATIGSPTSPAIITHGFYLGGVSGDMSIYRDDSGYGLTEPNANYRIIDADKVVRPGMGVYASGTVGMPMATVYNQPTNAANRPILLHRPFRSVAELGYVFMDSPFKNLDFDTPRSGNAALLDVFCINDSGRQDALIAGKVDLNTRQKDVLRAVLAEAYRDELASGGAATATSPYGLTSTVSGEADNVAKLLVTRTSTGPATGVNANKPQPLANVADLVGRYVSGTPPDPQYDGFSADDVSGGAGNTSPSGIVHRLRESSIRALSACGTAGTWNLLIDVVAQTGRYPTGAKALPDFLVEGEQRFWVHVAIDRQSGAVIDRQVEQVTE